MAQKYPFKVVRDIVRKARRVAAADRPAADRPAADRTEAERPATSIADDTVDMNVQGHVFDRRTNLPIPGARVSISYHLQTRNTVTNLSGDWIMLNVPIDAAQAAVVNGRPWTNARAFMNVSAEDYRLAEADIRLAYDALIVGLDPMFEEDTDA